MKNNRALAPWIKRFLLEYLPTDRNFSRNTQHSYRDTLRLLLIFTSATLHRKPDELLVADIRPDLVREFLRHIEDKRKCSVSTRNQRLAAVRSLATFIGEGSPEHLSWCAQLRSIPFKKSTHRPVGYLEKDEIEALLAAPDCGSRLGSRDHALLLFLYNTGARADEAAQLTISDLRLHGPQEKSQSFVQLHGKGEQDSLVSAVGVNYRRLEAVGHGAHRGGASVSWPLRASHDTIRCARYRHPLRQGDRGQSSRHTAQANRTAHD